VSGTRRDRGPAPAGGPRLLAPDDRAGLSPKKRDAAPKPKNPLAGRVVALDRTVTRLTPREERVEALVELQKKVAEFLGAVLPPNGGKP
jgi:hypothetical protein